MARAKPNMLGLQLPPLNSHIEPDMSAQMRTPNDDQRTILIVDDFDDTRLLLRTWLEKKGYRVVEAENGVEAVTEARSRRPDLIIMDVEMPELDGLAATREIRALKDTEQVPIVAVSAYGADQYRTFALAAGCDEYVSTPFEPDELEKIIRSLIR
jgi:two-component system, cell cycle response regulator DivK